MLNVLMLNFILLFFQAAFAIEIENVTGDDGASIKARNAVFDKKDNVGIRLAWDGMKKMNKKYNSGSVDDSVKNFEDTMLKRFNSDDFKKKNPGVKVEIKKMDFKGYYITCHPSDTCLDSVEDFVEKLPPGKIGIENFTLTSARGINYEEGYVNARAKASYPEYRKILDCKGANCPSKSLTKFINQKVEQAFKEINKKGTISNSELIEQLKEVIELERSGESIPADKKHLRPIVKVLDTLFETPYKNSNNLERELESALQNTEKPRPPKRFVMQTAISGDDLFAVIKDKNGNIAKILGADVRGLGVLNMISRFKYLTELHKQKKKINNFNELLNLSNEALKDADRKMEPSIKRYIQSVEDHINSPLLKRSDLNDALEKAHRSYYKDSIASTDLMQMRSASVPNCNLDKKCVMNSVSTIHNLIKKMEASGYDGHFGTNCIGMHYWMKKLNVQWPKD